MMESNHHKQIQSLPHYHYANPQLLKLERVEGIEPSHGLWKSPRLPLHHTRFKMAEREGFEPSVAFKDHNSLANCLFRPLRHLSIKF